MLLVPVTFVGVLIGARQMWRDPHHRVDPDNPPSWVPVSKEFWACWVCALPTGLVSVALILAGGSLLSVSEGVSPIGLYVGGLTFMAGMAGYVLVVRIVLVNRPARFVAPHNRWRQGFLAARRERRV